MKVKNWHQKLSDRIQSLKPIEFERAEMDCALFVLECVEAISGKDLCSYWRGEFDSEEGGIREARSWAEEENLDVEINSVGDWAEAYFPHIGMEEKHKNFVQRGDVVLIEEAGPNGLNAVGVCLGNDFAAVSEDEGLEFFKRDRVIKGWGFN